MHICGLVTVSDHLFSVQWDAFKRQWIKVGDLAEGPGTGRKVHFQGKDYDYVFDVDIQEGQPPLKLPYNISGTDTS